MSAMPPNSNPFLNANTPSPTPVPASASQSTSAPASKPAAQSTPAPQVPAKKQQDQSSGLGQIKDTVEAIIIALILALTFRAFMVEAFVIPTGSMAPTLLGAHYRVICPKCGYEFDESADVNRQLIGGTAGEVRQMSEGTLDDNTALPSDKYRTCPNCGYQISARDLPDQPGSTVFDRSVKVAEDRSGTTHEMFFPWANNGDRILVMKYQYAINEPKRWDVIVFKEPREGQLNYIKRLAGLPNETIEIIGGDLYAGPASKDGTPAPVLYIQRKPADVQKGMWQLVYDNDYYPIDAGKPREYGLLTGYTWTNPWTAAATDQASWDISGPVLSYTGASASSITFKQREFYLYNISGYNPNDFNRNPSNYDEELAPRNTTPSLNTHRFVGDLHLETLWTPDAKSTAAISMTLGLPYNCYRAGITSDGGTSHVVLERLDSDSHLFVALPENTPGLTFPASTAVMPGKPTPVEMDNVDHAVHFRVNGQEVIRYEPQWTDAQGHEWAKQLGADGIPPTIAIDVAGACTLGHLRLMRDVYYTNYATGTGAGRGTDGDPMTLREDEFFALGDNSNYSLDSRFWEKVDPRLWDLPGFSEQRNAYVGRVPRRYLLGKAFFVYWPAGFRPMDSVTFPIIPDAGHMRIIR